MILQLGGSRRPSGTITAPPSKSMAHRMLICSCLARGFSQVDGLDWSVDIKTTIAAMRQLGAKIDTGETSARVEGLPGGFATVTRPVDCSESGSTLRFIIPLFSLTGQQVRFTGAPRLFQRDLSAYEKIFTGQQLSFGATDHDLVIKGMLRPGAFSLAGNISSQFISGLLFALPLLEKDSTIHIQPPLESRSYIELTRAAQSLFGVQSEWLDEFTLRIPGGQRYAPRDTRVEGDWSNGAVPAVLGAVCGGVTVRGLSETSMQGDKAILDILARCGAEIRWNSGDLTVRPPEGGLVSPGDIDLADCPDLGPILSALLLFCKGQSRIINAGRLRIKESDRIASVEQELKKLGGKISTTQASITIEGGHPLLPGQTASSHNDHRLVMATTAAAICAGVPLSVEGAEAVNKSWPGYPQMLRELGLEVTLA